MKRIDAVPALRGKALVREPAQRFPGG